MYDRNIFKTESHGRKESVQSTTQNPLAQHATPAFGLFALRPTQQHRQPQYMDRFAALVLITD